MKLRTDEFLWTVVDKIYNRLYQISTPSGDWEQMKASGETKKEDFFNNYTVPQEKFDAILEEEIKNHKLHKYDAQRVKNTVYLGCSPKFEK